MWETRRLLLEEETLLMLKLGSCLTNDDSTSLLAWATAEGKTIRAPVMVEEGAIVVLPGYRVFMLKQTFGETGGTRNCIGGECLPDKIEACS